jgi:hypothetical protein
MATTMTGPMTISYPAIPGDLELRIQSGACRLRLTPADQDAWVTGSYVDPSRSIDVTNQTEGNRLTIRVGRSPADFFGLMSGVPELTLAVGKARPFALVIEAGASENHIDLGGLPLTSVQLNHGAGAAEVTFSAPNPVSMRELRFAVGAGKTDAYNLANANFQVLQVDGGAAGYVLDFAGAPLQNAMGRISTALASVELRIPVDRAVEVTSENLFGQPRADPGFVQQGKVWLSPAAVQGKPIELRIHSSTVMGQLQLRSR